MCVPATTLGRRRHPPRQQVAGEASRLLKGLGHLLAGVDVLDDAKSEQKKATVECECLHD